MGAVAKIIHYVAVVADCVGAIEIVDIAIFVIVLAVGATLAKALRTLLAVNPHIGGQVRVIEVNAGVDDSDNDLFRAGGHIPRLHGAHIRAVETTGLPDIVQTPELVKIGIIRRTRDMEQIVRLGIADARVTFQELHQIRGHIHLDRSQPLPDIGIFVVAVQIFLFGQSIVGVEIGDLLLGNTRAEADDQLTRHIGRRLFIGLGHRRGKDRARLRRDQQRQQQQDSQSKGRPFHDRVLLVQVERESGRSVNR